jgi:tRNA uridine 5-carboxymethylaminomethyl modification enzyme
MDAMREHAPEIVSESMRGVTYAQMLKRPEVTMELLLPVLGSLIGNHAGLTAAQYRNELKSVETEIKFAGYLAQQQRSIGRMKDAEKREIPAWFDYANVSGLSREMQEKLGRVRPATIGQASGIPGVTPAALSLINIFIEIQARKQTA